MTPDLKAKLETVLTALGMYEAGQQCTAPRKRISMDEVYCAEHREINDHDIPVPELTPELAWRVLLEAFRRAQKEFSVGRAKVIAQWAQDALDPRKGQTSAEALITAIASALEK